MGKLIHTVKIGNQTFTRESDSRAYTHAVVVVHTQAEHDAEVAKAADKAAATRAKIAALEPLAADPADQGEEAFWAVEDARLEEKVMETRKDGSVVATARWLTDAFRRECGEVDDGTYNPLALRKRNAVTDAWGKTATRRLYWARRQLEIDLRYLESKKSWPVGEVKCENWSQSAKGAAKLAEDVRRYRPLADIRVTADVEVRQRATRAKKA